MNLTSASARKRDVVEHNSYPASSMSVDVGIPRLRFPQDIYAEIADGPAIGPVEKSASGAHSTVSTRRVPQFTKSAYSAVFGV